MPRRWIGQDSVPEYRPGRSPTCHRANRLAGPLWREAYPTHNRYRGRGRGRRMADWSRLKRDFEVRRALGPGLRDTAGESIRAVLPEVGQLPHLNRRARVLGASEVER